LPDPRPTASLSAVDHRRIVSLERFGAPEVMRWTQTPMPARAPDEVLVAVQAFGINFADTMVRRGEYRRDQPLDFIPGFEAAGTVLESPPSGPPVGCTVVVFAENGGSYTDAIVAPVDRVYTVVDGVSAVQAAGLFTQGVTAWYSVHRFGQVTAGDAVLVHAGAGGLGALCIQLVVEAGGRAIATASTPEKLEIARGHGAFQALLSDPDTLTAAVREVTEGRGAKVIIDGVGGSLFTPSLRALAFGGRYVVVGSASQAPAMLDVRALMPRGQTVVGVLVARVAEDDPAEPQRAFDEVSRRFRDGILRPQISVRGPDDLAEIHRAIEARTLTGKVVVAFDKG
jgi:NADPH2:quinone reductase